MMENKKLLDEVLKDGRLVDESGDFDSYYSDAPGGCYEKLKIIDYNGNKYVYKEKISIDSQLNEDRKCVTFYKL